MNKSITSNVHASRMKFQVTAQNIADACKADSRHCMIADAIATQLPHVRNISVDMMTIRWSDPLKGWRYIYLTPNPAQEALVRYDMGLEVHPFSFQTRSGHATPMHLGSGKQRRRAHHVPEDKILKATDKGTIVHSVGRDSKRMWPAKNSAKAGAGLRADFVPEPPKGEYKEKGRPKAWHPSHHSLREFGMRGFTQGYEEIPGVYEAKNPAPRQAP